MALIEERSSGHVNMYRGTSLIRNWDSEIGWVFL